MGTQQKTKMNQKKLWLLRIGVLVIAALLTWELVFPTTGINPDTEAGGEQLRIVEVEQSWNKTTFHCNAFGGNGRVTPAVGPYDSNSSVKVFLVLQEIPDTTNWRLIAVKDSTDKKYDPPKCNSVHNGIICNNAEWISFSNNSGAPDGKNIQMNHPVPVATPKPTIAVTPTPSIGETSTPKPTETIETSPSEDPFGSPSPSPSEAIEETPTPEPTETIETSPSEDPFGSPSPSPEVTEDVTIGEDPYGATTPSPSPEENIDIFGIDDPYGASTPSPTPAMINVAETDSYGAAAVAVSPTAGDDSGSASLTVTGEEMPVWIIIAGAVLVLFGGGIIIARRSKKDRITR